MMERYGKKGTCSQSSKEIHLLTLQRVPEPTGCPEGLQDSEQTSPGRDAPGLEEWQGRTSKDPELQWSTVLPTHISEVPTRRSHPLWLSDSQLVSFEEHPLTVTLCEPLGFNQPPLSHAQEDTACSCKTQCSANLKNSLSHPTETCQSHSKSWPVFRLEKNCIPK